MRRTYLLTLLTWLVAGTALAGGGGSPAAPVSAQSQPGVWEERAPLLLPRSEMSIAELDGRIFAIGGYAGDRLTSDAVQVYDSRTDSWAFGPPLPLPMHGLTGAAYLDGWIHVPGGAWGPS